MVEPEYARQGDPASTRVHVDSAPLASDPRVTYRSRSDATPEGEVAALAAVYAFVLKCHEQKVAAEGVDGKNITEGDHVGESPEECTAREGGA